MGVLQILDFDKDAHSRVNEAPRRPCCTILPTGLMDSLYAVGFYMPQYCLSRYYTLTCQVGDSPLIVAVAEGHEVFARVLLRSGADKNYQNVSGQTALHIAASLGSFECVNALLEAHPT